MLYKNIQDIKLVSQGVDTLVSSHISINEDDYKTKFLSYLEELEFHKENAQTIEGISQDQRYIKFEFLKFGQFKMYAQGKGVYRYVVQNEDMTIFISNTKYGANDFKTPQVKIELRAHYLFALSHKKAYQIVLQIIKRLLGQTKNLCNRIDIYSDVQGIKYTYYDGVRFQTNYKEVDFKDGLKNRTYAKHKKVTGYSWGNADFMFRIYDKTNEIKFKQNKSFIKYKWIANNYDIKSNLPVWRHEAQYRRPELMKYTPRNLDDEVLFQFSQLDKLWHNATNKIRWTDLNNDEVFRISETELKSDSIRQIFHRARKDTLRLDFWNILSKFDNKLCLQVSKYKYIKESQDKTAKKFLKAYIGATYKARGANPDELINLIDDVVQDLRDFMGITLHDYGELKVVSNFIDNAKIQIEQGITIEHDHSAKAFLLYSKLTKKLKDSVIDSSIQKELNRADKFFKEIKVS